MTLSVQQIDTLGIVCIVIGILFVFKGYKNGAIFSIFSLIASLGSIFIAYYIALILNDTIQIAPTNYGGFTVFILNTSLYDRMNTFCLWIICFIVIRICFALLLPLLKVVNHVPLIGRLNKVLGLLFGALQALIVYILCIYVLSSPFVLNGEDALVSTNLIYIKEGLGLQTNNGLLYDLQQLQYMLEGSHINEVEEWLNGNGFSEQQVIEILTLMEGMDS